MAIFLHQGPPAEGVDYSTPHPVVTVELDEQQGLRFTSTVVGSANEDIRIGERVELDWIERGGMPLPVFRLEARARRRVVISARHPLKDQVAFAGAATTGFVARNSGRSPRALAVEACTRVLARDGAHGG